MDRRLLFASAAFFLACSSPSEPTGASDEALNTNDQAAYDFFVGKGLTNFQAAGIVGNLDQESNVNPNAIQQGGPGRGIAQWSVGGRWDTDSGDNAVAYAAKENLSVWSLQLQLDFIWYELTTFSGYGLASLEKTTNVTDATVVFETDFEGCGQCDQTNRINYAEAVLKAYGSIPYAASYVSQSFPLATSTLTMTEGDVIPSYIELKNTGTKTWDSNTKIGTTEPRDRSSVFADGTWLAPNRLAAVKGTVAPGATYKFEFDLAAPEKPGSYDEHFGVVEEGVAWFGDPGQGGPADDDLEVKILVVAKEGGANEDAGTKSDAGKTESDGGVIAPEGDAGDGSQNSTQAGGCNASGTHAGDASWMLALALGAVLSRKRR
jgi:uncharacterized protein (TIGR03382 family)